MMQPELFEPSWPFYDVIYSTGNQSEYCSLSSMDSQVGGCEFSSLFTTIDRQSEISSNPFSSAISGESVQFAASYDTLQVMSMMEDLPVDLEVFEPELIGEFEALYGCPEESVGSFPSQKFSVEESDLGSPSSSTKSEASMDVTSVQPILTFPGVDMEIDNELSVFHLLKSIGEAMEKGQRELEEVILRCISQKVSPLGKSLERLAFNLCQQVDTQCVDYLKQESLRNSEAAFKAFSQILPYVKFAHFTANSAILEATPVGIEMVHIVDFHMGEGLQWSEMIVAAAMQKKALKLTSIRWEEEKETDSDPLKWSFEETRRQLLDHARSFGIKLKVEEMGIEDLLSEVKKAKKRGGGREFWAFNCTVGLPHVRSIRSRRLVMEFLEVAKDLLAANSANCRTSNRGIIVLADGDPCEKLKNCSSFSQFFDGHLVHYQALLESMESTFPDRLTGARMTMECLFVSPYISSLAWSQKWEEIKEGFHLKTGFGFEGWSLSKESLVEAKVMVGEDSCYEVRIEGQNGNEAALEWRGVPLVRVSAWTSQI